MKNRIVLVSMLTLALAACAKDEHPVKTGPQALDPHNPTVDVNATNNITAPDTLYFDASERDKDTKITWHLISSNRQRFHRDDGSNNGIKFDEKAAGEIVDCHFIDDSTYQCTNKHTAAHSPNQYHYFINIDDDKGQNHQKDPTVANN